ncbi:MAG: diacylglycerol kinase family protein [Brumimicrobium sp.]
MLGFNHAFRGVLNMLRTERNFKIQFVLLLFTIIIGIVLKISLQEWIAIVISSCLVFGFEIINSAIEKTCDLISEDENSQIKWIKDVSAGAVLIICIGAVIVGCLIFIPYFY